MPIDITTIKYKKLVGIGEASHGTREYQKIRLRIIKHLKSLGSIEVFIEAPYPAIELIKGAGKSRAEFTAVVQSSTLFDFYKSTEFIEILWYLYSHKIPFYGVDIQIYGMQDVLVADPVMKHVRRFYSEMTASNQSMQYRDKRMQDLISILRNVKHRAVFLAHNYHVSKWVQFPGTSIAFATGGGTARAWNSATRRFETITLDYSNQALRLRSSSVVKTKKSFYQMGFTVDSDKQEDTGSKYDYVIYIPKTSAIK